MMFKLYVRRALLTCSIAVSALAFQINNANADLGIPGIPDPCDLAGAGAAILCGLPPYNPVFTEICNQYCLNECPQLGDDPRDPGQMVCRGFCVKKLNKEACNGSSIIQCMCGNVGACPQDTPRQPDKGCK